jgi:dATP pyrophosphohydrolase
MTRGSHPGGQAPSPTKSATAPGPGSNPKQPVSVLVLVHTFDLDVLLVERADFPGFWQSVTGSRDGDEPLASTAIRELAEETGIDALAHGGVADWRTTNVYEIYPRWRHRYAPGVTHNAEHVYGLALAARLPVRLAPREHVAHAWLPWREAAARVTSWSNRASILDLPARSARSHA